MIPPSGVSHGTIELNDPARGCGEAASPTEVISEPVPEGAGLSLGQSVQPGSVHATVPDAAAPSAVHDGQHSPAKPNAATEIMIKATLAIATGVHRPCFRIPGMKATIAITKQPTAIHLWNASSARKLSPSAGK